MDGRHCWQVSITQCHTTCVEHKSGRVFLWLRLDFLESSSHYVFVNNNDYPATITFISASDFSHMACREPHTIDVSQQYLSHSCDLFVYAVTHRSIRRVDADLRVGNKLVLCIWLKDTYTDLLFQCLTGLHTEIWCTCQFFHFLLVLSCSSEIYHCRLLVVGFAPGYKFSTNLQWSLQHTHTHTSNERTIFAFNIHSIHVKYQLTPTTICNSHTQIPGKTQQWTLPYKKVQSTITINLCATITTFKRTQ